LSLAPLPSILLLVGQEHGRTIPLAEIAPASFRIENSARPKIVRAHSVH
jgi:hypothetical protein